MRSKTIITTILSMLDMNARYQLELQLMEQKKSMIFREYFQMGQDLMMLSIKILNCGWSSSQEVLK